MGPYLYVGSARGAGGLRARVGRHLLGGGARHWHIDYLRADAEVLGAFYTVTDRMLECEWSQTLAQLPRAFIPVPHFGSSDCKSGCTAHLIAFPRFPGRSDLQRVLGQVARAPTVHLDFP
jgi:Uri superfamily endonuclease